MSDETFLARWARRKAEARKVEEPAPEGEPATGVEEQAQAAAEPADTDVPPDEETRERWISELEKIDVDSLGYDHDFAIYMRAWVPQRLRQKALRKLWTTNPTLACLDGLNDYEEDFTDAATVVANLKSDWLPGRGYKFLESLDEAHTAAADEEHQMDADPAEQEQPDQEQPVREPGEAGEQHAGLEADEDETEPTRER
jgi:hypothetical protein